MTDPDTNVIFLDVDNTLLDNDRIEADLDGHLERELGADCRRQYWEIFEALRAELGYADYLGAVQRYRERDLNDRRLLRLAEFLLDYPFAQRLYPAALEVIRHLDQQGQTVILSDGDAVFQPRKIQRSGLWDAVSGRVLIYIHKEQMLDAIVQTFPAHHYIIIEDKPRILQAMKDVLGDRLTTVFVRQGHYAKEPNQTAYRPADLAIECIGDLLTHDIPSLHTRARTHPEIARLS
ncbi:MAG: HAD family hydrolase [Xanthomonadales bacterium]|nr:HAD family hydrolase [Xanthomonadales bacterium]